MLNLLKSKVASFQYYSFGAVKLLSVFYYFCLIHDVYNLSDSSCNKSHLLWA